MLNFERGKPTNNVKDPAKPTLKPPIYEPPAAPAPPAAGNNLSARPATTPSMSPAPGSAAPVREPAPMPAVASAPRAQGGDAPESKLHVGVNIKLKGVEISDCDVLVIEGSVEATVHSKTMEVGEPGTLKGTALIDVAEITGEFTGELTARTRLIVHGTGRVSGTIRYGKLVVEEGGELSGDIQRISDRDVQGRAAAAAPDVRLGLSRELATGSDD
ncbi:MAG TPA: polymer-forming cytoskeletal protein [Casimicrobiaceae bacterium]|nr:polymer-forming cytoskeletal protein [Casimicrobiaceae bacterium]